MRRLDHVLSRVAERGDPLGADLLIDHLDRKLAGEPDPIVVARQRSGIMQTVKEQTTQQPGPPTRRRGLAVALASFVVVLIAGGGILLWAALDDDGGGEAAVPATTTVAPSTTQAPSGAGEPVGTFTFDGTTWSYDGPFALVAGPATFALVNTSSDPVAVISWFGMTGEELDTELAAVPVGNDMAVIADTPTPPSSFVFLVTAAPGQSVSATTVLGVGSHVIDAGTTTAGAADHVWRLAVVEVTEPASVPAGEAVGTFTFDGTTWSYDGPSNLEAAGPVTFSLVNTSSNRVGVFSWFGLSDEELDAELAVIPVGTDVGDPADAPPAPPSDLILLVEAAPGESASATTVMGAGTHLIDCATLAGLLDPTHLWRVAMIEVAG